MTLIEAIKLEIRERLNNITDDVINGVATDFAHYRYECGKAMGLVIAESVIEEFVKKANQSLMGDEE